MSKSWPQVKLGEVLRPISRPESVDPTKTYHILGAHWYAKGLYTKDVLTGTEIQAPRVYRVKEGDFVYNRLFGWKGSFALATHENDGCYVSNEFPCFTVNADRLEGQYLWLYFSRNAIWDEALGLSTGGTPTSRNRLKEDQFLSLEIPLPPLPEQRRIVARIEELSAKIEEARRLRERAQTETEPLIASAASATCTEDGIWGTVQDAVSNRQGSVRSGPFGSQLLHEEFVDSGVAAIGTRDVQVNRFELRGRWFITLGKFEQFKRYQVFPDDLLCTIVGASIGRFCVVPNDVPLAFTTKHIQALTLETKRIEPRFASYMLNLHGRCRDSLFSQVEGSAQPSLNAGKILGTALPMPPLSEQRGIVAYLDNVQAKVDALKKLQEETAKELNALMPSILSKAFSGEL